MDIGTVLLSNPLLKVFWLFPWYPLEQKKTLDHINCHYVSSVFCSLEQFLSLSLSFVILLSLESFGQLLCRMPLKQNYVIYPSDSIQVMFFGGQEDQRNDVLSFSVYCIRRYIMSICLLTGVNVDLLVKVESTRFFTVKLLFPPL